MKKKFKKVKNIVLELLVLANMLSLFICIAAVECNPKVAILIMLGNISFLLLMAWANGWIGEEDQDAVWIEVQPKGNDYSKAYVWKQIG